MSKQYPVSLAAESWKSASARNQSHTILNDSGGVWDDTIILGSIDTRFLKVCECSEPVADYRKGLRSGSGLQHHTWKLCTL